MDEAAISSSENYVAEFLNEFSKQNDCGKMRIVAHTTGNLDLIRGLKKDEGGAGLKSDGDENWGNHLRFPRMRTSACSAT